MHLKKRDVMATGMVAAALLLYLLSATKVTSSTPTGIRATGIAVLALGFMASASAVVPSFERLLHGNKAYLAGMSVAGVIAAVAGVYMLVNASRTSLTIVIAVMLALWFAATLHHSMPEPVASDDFAGTK
jgi:peptidoglycan/LPS O-acetylase OafA/YrhL